MKNLSKVSAVVVLAMISFGCAQQNLSKSDSANKTHIATIQTPTSNSAKATSLPSTKSALTSSPAAEISLFGLKSAADDVVFVIDRSGSMMDEIGYLKPELIKSISALDEGQVFHIIFFGEDKLLEMPPSVLKPASESNKKKAADFIQPIKAYGTGDPISAIITAIELLSDSDGNSKVIYFLTDVHFGDLDTAPEIMANIKNSNIVMNVIYCATVRPSEETRKTLKEIAQAGSGQYKMIVDDSPIEE